MTEQVKAIPEGFRSVTPHLVIRDAAKAIGYYKQAFGAEEIFSMPGPDGKLMHAEIRIGDSVVMIGEECLEWGAKGPQELGGSAVTLGLYVEDVDATFARAVETGATVRMPVSDQFWGDRYGQVIDPFGHIWSIATHVKDLTPEEMQAAAEVAMREMSQTAGQES
jgi:PhnB protein